MGSNVCFPSEGTLEGLRVNGTLEPICVGTEITLDRDLFLHGFGTVVNEAHVSLINLEKAELSRSLSLWSIINYPNSCPQ